MSRLSWVNLLLLLAALASALGLALRWGQAAAAGAQEVSSSGRVSHVQDATATPVAVQEYQRIVSVSTISDQLLLELIEPQRVLTVTGQTLRAQRDPWRWSGKVVIDGLEDLERVLELRPDLVICNGFGGRQRLVRARQAGLTLFDLGLMKGVETLAQNMEQLASLLGVPERGRQLWQRFLRRWRAVAADIPAEKRVGALYVGLLGGQLFGGAKGSSIHDVLRAAGLRDVATAAGYAGWPRYNTEQLLTINPPWVVTPRGREQQLCQRPGLAPLQACTKHQVVGVDERLLSDPGLQMLDAAEALRQAVYGPGRGRH